MDYTSIYKRLTSIHSMIPYTFFNGRAFSPLHILFELTYRCNLRCSMCQFLPLVSECGVLLKENPQIELSSDAVKSAIKGLPGRALLTLTGGEPLLRKDISDILRFASKKNRCHLITNGTLLNEEHIELLTSYAVGNIMGTGLLMIEISLEGTREIHDGITAIKGSFDKTVKNIRRLIEAKRKKNKNYPLINIATVITKKNISVLPDMVDLASDLEADIISFLTYSVYPHYNRLKKTVIVKKTNEEDRNSFIDKEILLKHMKNAVNRNKSHSSLSLRFSPHGCLREDIISFYSSNAADWEKDNFICFSPWTRAIVTSCGDVMPCSNYVIGNLRETPFNLLWNTKRFKEFRLMLKKEGVFSHCRGCCMLERKNI